jgi:hypothetical protein
MTVLHTHRHCPQLENLHYEIGVDLSHTSPFACKEICLLPLSERAATCEPEISSWVVPGNLQLLGWTGHLTHGRNTRAVTCMPHTPRLVSTEATGSIVVAVGGQSDDHLAIGRAEGRVECLPRLPLAALRRVGVLQRAGDGVRCCLGRQGLHARRLGQGKRGGIHGWWQ